MPTTINIDFGLTPLASTFVLTAVTRSDNGNPPSGISLPLSLTRGSPTGGIYPWTGTFTDNSPPPFYNATAVINGVTVPQALLIPGVNPSPAIGYTVVLGTGYQTIVPIVLPQDSAPIVVWNFVDGSNNPVNLTGKSIQLKGWQSADGGETKQTLFTKTTGAGIAIIGAGNAVQVTFSQADTASLINEWAQYNITILDTEQVIQSAPLSITPAFQ